MKTAWTILSTAAAAFVPAVVGIAQDTPAPTTRVETIPAHERWVEKEVVCEPAVMGERQIPAYETVKVPVVETRCVPVYQDVEEPVWATREVQAYEERQVPVKGPVEVPVFEGRRRPVKIEFTNPFTCCPVSWHLWDRCETVRVGSRTEEGVVGWRTEQTPVTRTENYVAGTRKRQVQVGERQETVTVAERDEQRCVGWRTETYVVRPAVTRASRERVRVPAETVTVVEAADTRGVTPAPGTTRVVTEQEFQRALAVATPEPTAPAPTAPAAPAPAEPAAPPMPQPTPATPAPAAPPTSDPEPRAPEDTSANPGSSVPAPALK